MPPTKSVIKSTDGTIIQPKDMNPQQLREHTQRLGRIRNKRAYARSKERLVGSGWVEGRGRGRLNVVNYDKDGKKILSLQVKQGSFLVTFG